MSSPSTTESKIEGERFPGVPVGCREREALILPSSPQPIVAPSTAVLTAPSGNGPARADLPNTTSTSTTSGTSPPQITAPAADASSAGDVFATLAVPGNVGSDGDSDVKSSDSSPLSSEASSRSQSISETELAVSAAKAKLQRNRREQEDLIRIIKAGDVVLRNRGHHLPELRHACAALSHAAD
eukprot:m.131313 g.131313  ORF g.131313 m.131313 type:complete len:184 (-) comp16458_c0_seq1:2033-2584(-)